jgi:hypothetical protein
MIRKSILASVVAAAAIAGTARADILELALVIDGSGSISSSDFELQRDGYVNALSDIAVLPLDGTVAIGVWQFSGQTGPGGIVQLEYPTTFITAATLPGLVAALNGMSQIGLNTAIGDGIQTAAADLLGNALTSDRQVIDVSTDGVNNRGVDPAVAAAAAIAAGIEQVNGLGIGGAANLSWVPAGSFAVNVPDFDAFEDAIKRKIRREVTGTPDGGMTLALLGSGLFGLALARRRASR